MSNQPDLLGEQVKILVVEDEEAVCNILKRILEQARYSVAVATNGDEALEIFRSEDRFDLLFTDIVMPGNLQGPALAKVIRSMSPEVPCIFMTGYASKASVRGNELRSSDIRLTKPVGRKEILNAVAKALSLEGVIE